jgi:hypothetical protein
MTLVIVNLKFSKPEVKSKFKMATAAILKIDKRLSVKHRLTDFDDIKTNDAQHDELHTISKTGCSVQNQDGCRRHLEFYILCCQFIAINRISTKFCNYILYITANPKKGKAEVEMQEIQDGGRHHFEFFR